MSTQSKTGRTGCTISDSRIYAKTAVFSACVYALLLGIIPSAHAQEVPAGCNFAGAGAAISRFPVSQVNHGERICYRVTYNNGTAGVNCELRNFDADLFLPDGSVIPILEDATIASGTSVTCPSADPRCVTPGDCTIAGQTGYEYVVDHADEVANFNACPPTFTPGTGRVVAYTYGEGDSITFPPDFANACATANNFVAHGSCCEPCSGTCVDEVTANECPAPGVFTLGATCDTAPACLVTCPGPVPPCEAGQVCNPATGLCINLPDAPLSTFCETDANLCTPEHCNGAGLCVPNGPAVTCPGPVPPCEGGQVCAPATGLCVPLPDAPLSTPCNTDASLCTPEHCDGFGLCVPNGPPVTCPGPIPPCEGGQTCIPATGLCSPLPDAPLSTPCEADGNLCTPDHCNGFGICVPNGPPVSCPGPVPPCEAGQICNPSTGLCQDLPDAVLSTPCEADANLCTPDHCNGAGLCVPNGPPVSCDPAIPPCEAGEICNPSTGLCQDLPDAVLSTPCEADANLCTPDHCNGAGLCVPNGPPRSCPGPVPPCEAGQVCIPATGLCTDLPDAPLSTPCEADGSLCTPDHCNGAGLCVPNGPPVSCDPAIPPCEAGEFCNPATGLCEDNLDAPLGTSCETCPGVDDLCVGCACDGAGNCVDVPDDPPCCGNGIVEPPETCDPPGSPLPGGGFCDENCGLCGNGVLDEGEECDPGNPALGCLGQQKPCKDIVCSPICLCVKVNKPNGLIVPSEEFCMDFRCLNGLALDNPKAAGVACGLAAPEGVCDTPDTCDGFGSCNSNYREADFVCRPAAGPCDVAERCSGLSEGCPENRFAASGTIVADDGNDCTWDVCDASGNAVHPNKPWGSACGDQIPVGPCDFADRCDGQGTCDPNPNTTGNCRMTVCRKLIDCLKGPEASYTPPSCSMVDFDNDGDVDLVDQAIFDTN